MLLSAKSGYKRILNTICYTSALGGTFYLSYKYNNNSFSSIFSRSIPISFNAQCEKGRVIDAYLTDLAEDTIDDHFHLRSSIAEVKKVRYPITTLFLMLLSLYINYLLFVHNKH